MFDSGVIMSEDKFAIFAHSIRKYANDHYKNSINSKKITPYPASEPDNKGKFVISDYGAATIYVTESELNLIEKVVNNKLNSLRDNTL